VEYFCILASFVCILAVYIWISISERSYFNVLTPWFVFLLPADYLLEFYHLLVFGPSASTFAYAYLYACYAATFLAFALGYTCFRTGALKLPLSTTNASGNGFAPYLVLACAIALYLPVLIQFRDQLANPRQIYEQTRTGYGVYSFSSTALCLMALVLLLFKRRLTGLELGIFSGICIAFLWLHGSKGPILSLLLILLMYLIYLRGRRISLTNFAVLGISLAVIGLGLFFITNPGLLLDSEGLEGISAYSDYTRNGMMVIDSDIAPHYGTLTLEQQIFSRIPRPLFPSKPNDFGSLYLAKHFFPEAFQQDSGAPAFSFGIEFADFGVLTLPVEFIFYLIGGILLRFFMTGLQRYRDPGSFILVLYCCGLPMIAVPGCFMLLETIVLASFVNLLNAIQLRSPGTQTPTGFYRQHQNGIG
jgi:hypothetical protein